MAGLNERQPDAEKDDLKDTLNTMESKIRRMRDQRSNHNKSARRFADQRDTIQAEYKELKSKLDEGLNKIREKKKEANSFRVRRDTAQEQLRVLFARAKSGHVDKRKSKNITAEFNKLNSTIAELEKQIETKYHTSYTTEQDLKIHPLPSNPPLLQTMSWNICAISIRRIFSGGLGSKYININNK